MSDIAAAEIAQRLGAVRIVDVRGAGEYTGAYGLPCDPRQGHIPGAINIDVQEMMLLSDEELTERLGIEAGAEVVAYCHSGSRSAMAVQILGRLGYNARNFVGSWHEWSQTQLPVESGLPE